MAKPIYVLGTGLSHNGSSVLLKDGKVLVGIEKERLSRIKHDGGNDTLTVEYCLDVAGITLSDVDLVVQCENFRYPNRNRFHGERPFAKYPQLPVIDISHHLAHAYSAAGTCPFEESHILVIDGCGSPYDQVIDNDSDSIITPDIEALWACNFVLEKDSFYFFDGKVCKPLIKDFSEKDMSLQMPITRHSIGGFYASVSEYVFGDLSDVGKLMGLAPFGDGAKYQQEAFVLNDGRLEMHPNWGDLLTSPCKDKQQFNDNFAYYADIAAWAQNQVSDAVAGLVKARMSTVQNKNLCYSGGVALNICANTRLMKDGLVDNLYVEPAAADNGLALGCAYYGWLKHLNMPRVKHDGGTCFGKSYAQSDIDKALTNADLNLLSIDKHLSHNELLQKCATLLADGKVLGWFQGGAEFGPRALGHRSILAHPGLPHLHNKINREVKNREDFRPFAPAVLAEDAATYFEDGSASPYMLAIDHTKSEFLALLKNTTHQDNTARLQTVERQKEPMFAKLLEAFKALSGISVLLNTSLNRRGQPIVETPQEAIELLQTSALDGLVIEDTLLLKV